MTQGCTQSGFWGGHPLEICFIMPATTIFYSNNFYKCSRGGFEVATKGVFKGGYRGTSSHTVIFIVKILRVYYTIWRAEKIFLSIIHSNV